MKFLVVPAFLTLHSRLKLDMENSMKSGHLKILITAACSSAITAAILTLPQLLSAVSAAPPAAPLSQVARTPIVQTTIDIGGTPYRMDVIEIALDVGAGLPLHQ